MYLVLRGIPQQQPLRQILGKKRTQLLGVASFAVCVVLQLVFSDTSHIEVTGLGVSHHQPAGAGMRLHGTVFSKTDSDGGEVDKAVEVEDQALVREAGITYCGTDSLKTFGVEFRNRELFGCRIAPIMFAHSLMSALRCRLCQAVGQRLTEQVSVIILSFVGVLYRFVSSSTENTYPVCFPRSIHRTNEVGNTEKGSRLLAQERERASRIVPS